MTVPELGLSRHRICRDHVLVFPPLLPVRGQWEGADGQVARFSFAPRFIEAVSSEVGLPLPGLKRFWHAFFPIDHRLEALCWLLMEETESQCPHGPSYFRGLAHALAVGVLSTVRDQPSGGRRPWAVPSGIHRVVQILETNFARDHSLADLAAQARLSRSHFAQAFRKLTGHAPHRYLLRVRLSHARRMLSQENEAMSLSEIAAACGFFDQAHLSRHFQRAFGMTLTSFRRRQRHS